MRVSLLTLPVLPVGRRVEGGTGNCLFDVEGTQLATPVDVDFREGQYKFVYASTLRSHGSSAFNRDDLEDYDAPLLVSKASASGARVIIPWYVLLQFFWNRSYLIRRLQSGGLGVRGSSLHVPDHLVVERDSVTLRLRAGIPVSDVRYVAALLADPKALAAAQNIASQFASASQRTSLALRVGPPFSELMRLMCVSRPIDVEGDEIDGGEYRYIRRILNADYAPAWLKDVYYSVEGEERERDEAVDVAEDEKQELRTIRRVREQSSVEELSDLPAGDKSAAGNMALLASVEDMFPRLSRVETTRLKIEAERDPRAPRQMLAVDADARSALDGPVVGENDAVFGELVGGKSEQSEPKEFEEAVEAAQPDDPPSEDRSQSLDEHLHLFERGIRELPAVLDIRGTSLTLNWEFIDPYKRSSFDSAQPFFPLPGKVKGEELPWFYRDKELQVAKWALCVRLRVTDEAGGMSSTRYLLDFEADNKGKRNSFLGLWNAGATSYNEGNFENGPLRWAIVRTAQTGHPKIGPLSPEVTTRTFNHSSGGVVSLVRRLFESLDTP